MKNAFFQIFCLLYFLPLFVLTGCGKAIPPIINTKEAYQKLQKVCEQELNTSPIITETGKTLHIFFPITFDLIELKPEKTPIKDQRTAQQKRQINFLETSLKNNVIRVEYDISQVSAYPKSLGYTSGTPEQFTKIYDGLLKAINRSLGDLDPNDRPDFISLLIININNGVGMKNIFFYPDLKRYQEQSLPHEEFILRYTTEMTGNINYLNNPKGQGMNVQDISWSEFITQQISHRINFKYTRSSFPPTGNNVDEIMAVVHDTISAYDFNNFETIELNDLASGETFLFTKNQLETFQNK